MKKVYLSLLLHGNMCYDRYTKQEIRDKFPVIYAGGIRALHAFPQVTAHIDYPGLTALSLKHHAPWLLDEMRPLIARKQIVMVGCQYAASHALCADEESDVVASRLTMQILRDELNTEVSAFFPQEMVFHPQYPVIMRMVGADQLIVMPRNWQRPRVVTGVDGSETTVFPLNLATCRLDALEEFYDTHNDGDFVMAGGDFELLSNLDRAVEVIEALAAKGKCIEWTTIERYANEIGVKERCLAPTPFGQTTDDSIASPSFSRWVGDPEDMIWHGHAVRAVEQLRAASFADMVAVMHGLAPIDVPIEQSWSALPDNPWDHFFEHVNEYPETEKRYLSREGASTLLSRAWHYLLIGLNSDASGWFPWQPRTRHRNLCLQAATRLADEALARFANAIAPRLSAHEGTGQGWLLALNPGPARTVDISYDADLPMAITSADGAPLVGQSTTKHARWTASAEVDMPAYGYRLLRLQQAQPTAPPQWADGDCAQYAHTVAALRNGVLTIDHAGNALYVSVAPFRVSDPSGVAETEEVTPNWRNARTRVRSSAGGAELEVFTEVTWAVWLRLVLRLCRDRVEIIAEAHVDMPRRIGRLEYNPDGLLICLKGQPGKVSYDIPYATIDHPNSERSYITAQRFVAIESDKPFGVVSLGGAQSFMVHAEEGAIGLNLGASTQGRPDTRPQCTVNPDGTGSHEITSNGDPFYGTYEHRFALVFGRASQLANEARRLRAPAPILLVHPGGGDWPCEQSLLEVAPDTVHVTAFRRDKTGSQLVLNDISGKPSSAKVQHEQVQLGAFGVQVVAVNG